MWKWEKIKVSSQTTWIWLLWTLSAEFAEANLSLWCPPRLILGPIQFSSVWHHLAIFCEVISCLLSLIFFWHGFSSYTRVQTLKSSSQSKQSLYLIIKHICICTCFMSNRILNCYCGAERALRDKPLRLAALEWTDFHCFVPASIINARCPAAPCMMCSSALLLPSTKR